MSVRIMTDSACDLELEQEKRLGLDIRIIPVFFGEDMYREGENMTRETFYERLAATEILPKTAQITPVEFEDRFRLYREAGDEIVVVPLAKELSGTYQSACMAKEHFPGEPIYIVDSRQVTFGLALLVEQAAALRDAGKSGAEIAQAITALAARVRLYAVIDDLKYLRMGGRLSSAGAVLGTLLGIKPIISVQDGQVVSVHKARGIKAGFTHLLERAHSDGIDTSLPVSFGHSNLPEAAQELRDLAADLTDGCPRAEIYGIGPVVGTHAGPGCAGLAFFAKG